jgi:hypothetical protein
MKTILFMGLSLFATVALAAPSQSQVNTKAFEILVVNSSKLISQDGHKVSAILAESLVTDEQTHNKVSNSCAYDQNDEAFKCRLMILNADDQKAGREESSIEIYYQLEKAANGLPSANPFFLSVEVVQAG